MGQGLAFHAGHETGRQFVVQICLAVRAAGFHFHFMDETAQAKAGHTGKDVGIGTDDGTGKGRNAHGMILGKVCTASPAGTVDAEARGRTGAPVPAARQGQKPILARGVSGLKPEGWGPEQEARGTLAMDGIREGRGKDVLRGTAQGREGHGRICPPMAAAGHCRLCAFIPGRGRAACILRAPSPSVRCGR